jgi:hypothetical protein
MIVGSCDPSLTLSSKVISDRHLLGDSAKLVKFLRHHPQLANDAGSRLVRVV